MRKTTKLHIIKRLAIMFLPRTLRTPRCSQNARKAFLNAPNLQKLPAALLRKTSLRKAKFPPRLRSAQGGSNFAFLRSVFLRLLQHGSATNKVETSFKYDGSQNLHDSSFISVPAETMRPNESRRTDYAETSICLTNVNCAPAAKTY